MSHNVTTFLSSLDHLPNYKVGNTTKVSFFWDQSQDMSSSGFPPNKQASIWLTYLVYQLQACFFSGKLLELMSWLGFLEKLTLGTWFFFFFFNAILRLYYLYSLEMLPTYVLTLFALSSGKFCLWGNNIYRMRSNVYIVEYLRLQIRPININVCSCRKAIATTTTHIEYVIILICIHM